ncbi:RagB/SusD family nutrient uptake outer membrane protein [Porifericola rhodea]|uniref:RagB/SusD family nutrient uptake outer membrane protein n=1 Tax=Porifericola rhodea TaxID=930972 RepID=UPI002666820C|nr:RagB/SusD family nutrient uptake outer membrane protein [Porifericola rhodea]WKN29697.1 RagB/SusD family nutrient uptake outer membrane protein [Porifericola rhodea]
MQKFIYSNKYRFVISLSLILVLFPLSYCSDEVLDINDPNRLSPDLFWKTAEDAEKALVGVYSPLTTIPGWGRMLGAILTIQRSDIVNTFPQPAVNDVGTFNVVATDGRVNEGWGELNAIVARANQVLANVPEIEMDENRKAEIIGEAHFLRGFAHFYLLNMWGNIPLITEPVNKTEDLFVEQADQSTVWESIKSDFQEAQSRLPESWAAEELGRATWGAATAMLGKAHLYTQNWTEAATEFKKVIDSDLYQLVSNYQDNFLPETNNNTESIFELQYESSSDGNWGPSGTPNPQRGQAWEPDIAPKGYTSQKSVSVNQWVYDLFMKEKTTEGETDPRAYATILWNYPGAKVYQDDFSDAFNGDDLNKIWVRKYLNFERTSSLTPGSWSYSANNRRVIRLADVLLMYAEAENEANGPGQAVYDAINQVRARANMPAIPEGLSQDEIRQKIRDERVLELALEGDRFLDLLRWGIAADVFEEHPEYRSNSGGVFQRGTHEYLPIPQNDIDTNPKFEQNPGY